MNRSAGLLAQLTALWLLTTLVVALPATAQTEAQISAVRAAQRSAYAITDSTNGCPRLDREFFGWPAGSVRECEYAKQDDGLGRRRQAVAYLLDVEPQTIARWIVGACSLLKPEAPRCFETVLVRGKNNSGYMFAVAGNVIEDMYRPRFFRNYFFRHGMTVSFEQCVNGSADDLPLARQRELAQRPDAAVLAIPTGMTRFWPTTPAQFAARFPDSGTRPALNSAADRAAWLTLAQQEMLAARDGPRNRLLEAYLCTEAPRLFGSRCAAAR